MCDHRYENKFSDYKHIHKAGNVHYCIIKHWNLLFFGYPKTFEINLLHEEKINWKVFHAKCEIYEYYME